MARLRSAAEGDYQRGYADGYADALRNDFWEYPDEYYINSIYGIGYNAGVDAARALPPVVRYGGRGPDGLQAAVYGEADGLADVWPYGIRGWGGKALEALVAAGAELRWDAETGRCGVSSPWLDEVAGTPGVWVMLDAAQVGGLPPDGASAWMLNAAADIATTPLAIWSNAEALTADLTAALGDATFRATADGWTWNTAELENTLADALEPWMVLGEPCGRPTVDVSLTVDTDGGFRLRAAIAARGYSLDLTAAGSDGSGDWKLAMRLADVFRWDASGTTEVTPSDLPPETAPPAGAPVTDSLRNTMN